MPGEISDLRKINAEALWPLLEEEIAEWQRELTWDFRPTAELVKLHVAMRHLGGAALVIDGSVEGYGYSVVEDGRAVIGDIYVRATRRAPGVEAELFHAILRAAAETRGVVRVESQLMLTGNASAQLIRDGAPVRLFERIYMRRTRGGALDSTGNCIGFRFSMWDNRMAAAAGQVIASAYQGEADAKINSMYRAPGTARQFLGNIVDFPGCGRFDAESSFMAWDERTGDVSGMVLSTFVAEGAGHVAQLCVVPEARGRGLGSHLLEMSLNAIGARGGETIALTVTASNAPAVSLYRKFGFEEVRRFHAYVWEAA